MGNEAGGWREEGETKEPCTVDGGDGAVGERKHCAASLLQTQGRRAVGTWSIVVAAAATPAVVVPRGRPPPCPATTRWMCGRGAAGLGRATGLQRGGALGRPGANRLDALREAPAPRKPLHPLHSLATSRVIRKVISSTCLTKPSQKTEIKIDLSEHEFFSWKVRSPQRIRGQALLNAHPAGPSLPAGTGSQ